MSWQCMAHNVHSHTQIPQTHAAHIHHNHTEDSKQTRSWIYLCAVYSSVCVLLPLLFLPYFVPVIFISLFFICEPAKTFWPRSYFSFVFTSSAEWQTFARRVVTVLHFKLVNVYVYCTSVLVIVALCFTVTVCFGIRIIYICAVCCIVASWLQSWSVRAPRWY